MQYAVGRIYFDTLEEYASYARSVVAAETSGLALPRRAAFFATQHAGDQATTLSANDLIKPLAAWAAQERQDWEIQSFCEELATKPQLAQLLGGDETPALLFGATHGMGFRNGSPRQLLHQGALACQEWPGPQWRQPVPQDHYFAGEDLGADARLLGLISFFFACFGAGTPQIGDFHRQAAKERQEIAPHAFIADLPRRMLGHPKRRGAGGDRPRRYGLELLVQLGPRRTTAPDLPEHADAAARWPPDRLGDRVVQRALCRAGLRPERGA